MDTRLDALELAITTAGGHAQLAKLLTAQGYKVSRYQVIRWRAKGEVPGYLVIPISAATGVPAYHLLGTKQFRSPNV